MMKRIGALILILSAALGGVAAAGYFWTVRGPWLDSVFSSALSQRLGWEVECKNVRMARWSRMDFDSATVKSGPKDTLAKTGAGAILFQSSPLNLIGAVTRTNLDLKQISLAEDFGGNTPFASSLPEGLIKSPLNVDEASVIVAKHDKLTNIHLIRFVSEGVVLRGGAQVKEGRIVKAHAIILFAGDRFNRLPEEIRMRMMRRQNGWQGFRFVYGQNVLTVMGAQGPLLKAQWKS